MSRKTTILPSRSIRLFFYGTVLYYYRVERIFEIVSKQGKLLHYAAYDQVLEEIGHDSTVKEFVRTFPDAIREGWLKEDFRECYQIIKDRFKNFSDYLSKIDKDFWDLRRLRVREIKRDLYEISVEVESNEI